MQKKYDKLAEQGDRPKRIYIEKYSYLIENLYKNNYDWKKISANHLIFKTNRNIILKNTINEWRKNMKALITTLITLVFLFTAPAFAKGPGGAGKGVQNRERVREHVKTRSRVMEGEAGDKVEKIKKRKREQAKERIKEAKEAKEEKQEMVKEKTKKAKKGLEKQREKKSEQVQKELGKGSEKGQEARETRKKWWKFFEKGE